MSSAIFIESEESGALNRWMNYIVRLAAAAPPVQPDWTDPIWQRAETLKVQLLQQIELEIATPVVWTVGFSIPLALFEHYVGPLGTLAGQVWRSNFFKCAEENSRPHWASWSPVDEFNFHRPNCFGSLRLA